MCPREKKVNKWGCPPAVHFGGQASHAGAGAKDMAHARISPLGRFISRLSIAHLVADAPDDELVERFAVHREEAAFAALVRRHGPLVFGVCRRVLTDPHAAEDCFQATFLVLARKAGFLKRPKALGPWLYGVATRTALRARARAARRRMCEHRCAVVEAVMPSDGLLWRDLRPKLDGAIARLPEKYRTPFILHYLEGLTVAEVAQRLDCPQGTTCARLARAKEQLRARLARQGVGWCAGALVTALAQGAVPTPLAAATVQAAISIAAVKMAGALSATAFALTMGGLEGMRASKKVLLAVFLTAGGLGIGLGVSQHAGPRGTHAGTQRPSAHGARQATGSQPLADYAPVNERYYAGGFRSLRGFEFRCIPLNNGSGASGRDEPQITEPEPEDILIDVRQQRTGSLMFGLGVNSDAGLTGSILLNETNFDITRIPTGWDDILSGRATRDAGQELRIEVMPGTAIRRYSATWNEPHLFDADLRLPVSGYAGDVADNEDTESRLRNRITIGRRLNQCWTANITFRKEDVGIHDVPPSDLIECQVAEGKHVGPKGINSIAVSGDFMFLNSLEYQIPIMANDEFWLVAFCDSGTVESSVEIKDHGVPSGDGVRIVVPMLGPVPIALDFGFPIARGADVRRFLSL
jgi:RNA polymerase sigma factor (sigma-70 family)